MWNHNMLSLYILKYWQGLWHKNVIYRISRYTDWARVRHSPEQCRWDQWMTPSVHKPCFYFWSPIINLNYGFLTEYLALVASSSPSLSQLIIGFGFPWAEQLSRVLPPSFASTYCGGVAVNEGGAAEKAKRDTSLTVINIQQQSKKTTWLSSEWMCVIFYGLRGQISVLSNPRQHRPNTEWGNMFAEHAELMPRCTEYTHDLFFANFKQVWCNTTQRSCTDCDDRVHGRCWDRTLCSAAVLWVDVQRCRSCSFPAWMWYSDLKKWHRV